MTNFDKVKEMMDVEEITVYSNLLCKTIQKMRNAEMCEAGCERCKEWLKEEYKEPILTDKEREYLSTVIKPFQEYVMCIEKCHDYLKGTNKKYIQMELADDTAINLPIFDTCDMKFQNMQFDMRYTTIDLGI